MKKYAFLLALVLIFGLYFHLVAAPELKLFVVILAGLLLVGLAAVIAILAWLAVEKLRLVRVKRIEAEKEAHVKVVTTGNQVFIRETDHRAYWRAAHLDPRFYANGHYTEPNPTELDAWRAFNAPRVIQQQAAALLPAAAPAPVDLLSGLDHVQRCLIVGASDVGKTTLLQWLISRRLSVSSVIVIDPHAWPGKWPDGCVVVGQGRDYAEIDRALAALVQLMSKRYDEIGRGLVAEMAHKKITIFVDEWRAIVYNVKGAAEAIKTLLTESRKAAFTVFVATHSDRAKPLGLEGEYDLKDGFAVVRLSLVNGQRRATLDTGAGEQPAALPGPFSGGGRSFVIVGDRPQPAADFSLKPQPDQTERRVIDLKHQGQSDSAIAREVLGHDGGNQLKTVRQILNRFEETVTP